MIGLVRMFKRLVPWGLCAVLFWAVIAVLGEAVPYLLNPAAQLDTADLYHKKRDYSEAAAVYKSIIEQYPGTIDALRAQKGLTMLLIDLKEYEQAKVAFEQLIDGFANDANLPEAIYEIGQKYKSMRKHKQAGEIYEYLIKSYPGNVYALWAKGRKVISGIEFGDVNRARTAMDDLVAEPTGHPDIVRLFSDIINHRPVRYKTWWAETYRQTDDGAKVRIGGGGGPAQNWEEERQLYEYVIEQYPRTVYALHSLKNLAVRDIASIKQHPGRIFISSPGQRYVPLINAEREAEAWMLVEWLFTDFSWHPDFPGAIYYIADRYKCHFEEKPELAEELYQYLIREFRNSKYAMEAQTGLVTLYICTGSQTEADAELNKLIRDFRGDPNLPALVYKVGWYWELEEEKYEPAEVVYEWLAKEYPDSQYGVWARGKLLGLDIKRGEDDNLLVGIDSLIEDFARHPALPKALWFVAMGYRSVSKHTQAIEVFEFLREQCPDSPVICDALYNIGYCYRLLEDYDEAAQYYQKVLKDYPDSSYVRYLPNSIGDLYTSAGQYDKALYWYDQQSKLSYDELSADRALFSKSVIYLHRLKDYDKALEVLLEYQQKFPEGEHANGIPYCLAQCNQKLDNKEKVIKALEEGL
ncbi:MAG: tetratricopeptide repeat protein [Phycisphaerae bacterium]